MRRTRIRSLLLLVAITAPAAFGATDNAKTPRTASGHPDLSGNYDSGTLTPLTRPAAFGDKLYMTVEEANKLAKDEQELLARAGAQSDPNRTAPPEGGAAPFNAPDQQRTEERHHRREVDDVDGGAQVDRWPVHREAFHPLEKGQ